MAKNLISVMFGFQGQTPRIVKVASGATVKSVLAQAKVENPSGSLSINGDAADLTDRVSAGDLIELTPKAAGGR
jgi:hypothetical protein